MAKEIIAILTADLHLESRGRWSRRPTLRGDAFYSFEQICDRAIKEEVPILAAGDLLESAKPDSETMRRLALQLNHLNEFSSIKFLFIQGNHDRTSPAWFSALGLPHVIHLPAQSQPCSVKGHRFTIAGIDAAHQDELAAQLAALKPVDVLLTHQAWDELVGGLFPYTNGPATVITGAELVVNGDIHVSVYKTLTNSSGGKFRLLSPGSTNLRAIDETPLKRYYLMYEDLSVREQLLRTRLLWTSQPLLEPDAFAEHMEHIIPATLERLDETAMSQELPEEIATPILWLTLHESLVREGAQPKLLKAFGQRAHLFFRELVEETEATVVRRKERQRIRKDGVMGCVDLLVPDKSSRLYKQLIRLLSTPDSSEELGLMRAEALQPEVVHGATN